MDERGRSTEDIRRDIARDEENLSRTAQQIGDRVKEQLDWSEYVKDSPYWALGIAGGIGFFASRLLQTRTTTMERIIGSLAEEVRGSHGGLHIGAARPSLTQLALLGVGTKLAADLIRKASSTSESQEEGNSTSNPDATIKTTKY